MSQIPLLQILHVDQDFFKYNGIKTYNCIVSDSFGSQAAQIIGLAPKFSKKQKLPIVAAIRYKIEQGLQANLMILEFDILENEVDRILGNPKCKFVILNNQPQNALNEYLNDSKNQRKVNKSLKLEELKEMRKQNMSIRELNPFNINKNSVLKAKVVDVSDLKTFSKEGSFGEYFTFHLIDKNGDQIMAVVFNDEELRDEIQVGEIYEIQDFNVKEQTGRFQLLQTPYSIILKSTTKIQQIDCIIKPQGCTIAQAKQKPMGSFINLIAFIQVECDIEHQAGWKKDKSRKQIVLKDQTGIILLNIVN